MLVYAHYFTETRADVSQSIPRWRNWFGTAVLRIVVSSDSIKRQLRPATVKAACLRRGWWAGGSGLGDPIAGVGASWAWPLRLYSDFFAGMSEELNGARWSIVVFRH